MAKERRGKSIENFSHTEAKRKNIPSAEHESVLPPEHEEVEKLRYPRNTDLDPQLVWRGKDEKDWSDLVVPAPPLYIQEKVHPKALIDDLVRASDAEGDWGEDQVDLFGDFNGIPEGADKTDFYAHDQNWSNRMILGDSLQVMASLAEREGLRGKVQCIYFDPPYGIKFNSNFQWSTTTTQVSDGKSDHITREPEQVRAFRDTWRDGIHSYLSYLRDRLTVARDLLTETGSIFVQIGEENVHRARALLDEVFSDECFVSQITYKTSIGLGSGTIDNTTNYILWYGRSSSIKFRPLFHELTPGEEGATRYRWAKLPDLTEVLLSPAEIGSGQIPDGARLFRDQGLTSRSASKTTVFPVRFAGKQFKPSSGGWRTSETGMRRVIRADRVMETGKNISFRKYFDDSAILAVDNFWNDVSGGITSRADPKIYVVQTSTKIVQRCILMATDPGDLVIDPTCGAGTTAYVAEEWGRRWITIDTSRVALTLARSRVMGARFPYYVLSDSPAGQAIQSELTQSAPSTAPTYGDLRSGFTNHRVPKITLRDIANNAEIDVIWDQYQRKLDEIRNRVNDLAGLELPSWQMPRHPGNPWPARAKREHERFRRVSTDATRQKAVDKVNEILGRGYSIDDFPETPVDDWTDPELLRLHRSWWELRIRRQEEIDTAIASRAESETLVDKPFEDSSRVRVAGPFTVESLSPHRTLGVDENDELIDPLKVKESPGDYANLPEFGQMVLQNLEMAGVQQAHKADRIDFSSLRGWPGEFICAEGRYQEGAREMRAGIFIGPEFGTVRRSDLVDAAREAGDADFDVVIACAFNYEPHASEFNQLGRIPVLKARMNADLHMADDLKNTGSGNLFVIFGEPDIDLLETKDDQVQVRINGVDVFDPGTGEVRSDGPDGIACWFIDTDYNGESFFVRHAYFLGANDPYKSLKTTLKAEIDEDAWASLHSDTSRPFPRSPSGRVAVKVINHLGDEVMKVFRVE